MSCAWKTAKSFRELGWVLHSPSPTSAKLIIRKGRNCTLFSVFLHALTNSLAMFPSSQAGRRTGEGMEARQPGTRRCSCQGPFVEHPWVPLAFYLGMQSPWQQTGVPWRSRKPAVPAVEPHLHPAAEPQLHTGPPCPQPSAPQCPPAAGPGGPAGLTCCLQGGRGSLVLRLQREPPKKLRWPPRAGWCCGRTGVWRLRGLGAAAAAVAVSPLALITQVKMACLVGAFQPLRHRVAGISQGRNLPAWLLLSPHLTASAG